MKEEEATCILCVYIKRGGGRLGCDASNCDTVSTDVQVCGHEYMKTGSIENGGGDQQTTCYYCLIRLNWTRKKLNFSGDKHSSTLLS